MVADRTRDANTARLRQSFKSGRDIHAVAMKIVLDDDVSEV